MRNCISPANGSEDRVTRGRNRIRRIACDPGRTGLFSPSTRTLPILPILLLCAAISLAIPRTVQAQDSWFGPDKILHFFGGFMVTSVSYVVAWEAWDYEHERALRFGVGMGIAASVGKELYDVLSGRGHASGKDLVWDGLGIGLGVLFLDAMADRAAGGVRPTEAGFQGRHSLRQLSLTPGRPWYRPVFTLPDFGLSKSVDTMGRVPTFGLPPGGILKRDRKPEGD